MDSSSVSFLPEIQLIMYSMGDCRRPLVESAKIIEETVLHQMQQYIRQAQMNAKQRNELWFNGEDLMFILRNDRILLQRLVNCLKMNDIKYRMKTQAAVRAEDDEIEAWDENGGDLASKQTSKRIKMCETMLEKLDPTGDLLTLLDDSGEDSVKRERLMRAAAYATSIDSGEYMRFTEARQVSFMAKPQQYRRFREWLFGPVVDPPYGTTEQTSDFYFGSYKPTMITLEILNFLTYETIATLMDCAFFVKRECAPNFADQVNDVVRLRPQAATPTTLTNVKTPTFGGDLLSPQSSNVPLQKCARNSQQVALLLAQHVRNKSQQNQQLEDGINTLMNVAVQPWELREAIRRLRYYNNGRSAFLLFGCNNFSSGLLAK